MKRAVTALFMLEPGLVRSAINFDGNPAVTPLGDGDPAPIHSPRTYEPDQHDCLLLCVAFADVHSWTPYLSVDRFAAPLDEPASTILNRGCRLTSGPASETNMSSYFSGAMENPKKSEALFDPPLSSAPACVAGTLEVQGNLQTAGSICSGGKVAAQVVSGLLRGIESFFKSPDNCDENFMFASGRQPERIFGIAIGTAGDHAALRRTALA
ncbi:hypothetical protein N657DRAFT_666975 [Parathielavia appendiculata]|uniref:Uncharacterized protein n=1 Tax=Parathielavia appendiculata TaxID=2587402 RepID=A0AAN6YYX1_9PEZI|nr:hypothetical protein N657DRAFT_666975 [Parathielavia appendiculata]